MKKRLTSYTFDASAKTVLHADFSDITLAGIQLIVNVTDQIIIYNFADTAKGGTLSTDTLTLEYDTTSMDDADELMVLVDDAVTTQTVSAVNLDIRDLAQASDNVRVYANTAKDGSGTGFVPLVDADGHLQIDVLSGGGSGTQYTEGDTDSSITGTAMLWEDGSDTLRAVSASKPLPVDLQDTTVAVTQSGTWDEVGINDSGNSITVDNNGTFVTQIDGAALTALQLIDDVVYIDDADWTDNTSKHTLVGGVYQSSPHTVTDGDVTPFLTDVNGRLAVTVGNTVTVGSHAVTNAGVFVVQVDGSALTALQLIDDPVATLGTTTYSEATTKGTIMGAVRRDADTTLVDTTNEISPLQVDANGRLKVEVFDGGDSHTVDNGGTFVVQVDGNALTALQLIDDIVYVDDTATHATGSSKGALIMAAATPTDTAVSANDIGAVAMTTDRKLHVAVMDALPAGSAAIGKLAANSGIDIGDVDVTSVVPGTGASNLGKPEDGGHTSGDVGVMALGIRVDTPNAARADTDLDYIPLATYRTGAVRTAIPEEDFAVLGSNHVKKYYTNAGAVTDGIIWSPAAGKRWYVTDIFINVSASATVTLEDDLAAGDSPVWKAELYGNSGWSHHFATPLFSGEDAADLIITTSAGNVYVMVVGYEI